MNRLFLTFIFLCGILLKTGAQEVSGTVIDNQNRVLEFVSVTLLQAADSSFVGGCVSDGQGRFCLPLNGLQPTGLLLKASSLSYKTIVMNLAAQTTGLQLLMEDDMVEYASVIVKGKRPFTKNVGDKMVFNPQLLNHIDAMQVDDMLQYVPGVMVINDGVWFNGKSAVILVDDREVSIDYLANLNAADIERVELRKSHGGIYSSTIQGGIIHIVTKKGLLGLRGTASLYGGTKFRRTYELQPRANTFFGSRKWNVYARYSFDQNRSKSHYDITNDFLYNNTIHESNMDDVTNQKSHRYAVGSVLNFSENHQVSLELNGSHSPYSSCISSTADQTLTFADGSRHTAVMTTENPIKSDFYNAAGSYKWDVDTLGSHLKLLMNYNKKMIQNDSHLITTYSDLPANNIDEIDAAKMDVSNVSGRADLEKNWKSGWKLTLGAEYSTTKRYSETVFNFLLDHTAETRIWNYREQIATGHLGAEKQLGRFYAIFRMRAEYTHLRGYASESDEVRRNGTDVLPYLYLRYSTDNGWNFDAAYTHTLNRPGFNDLNGYMERYNDVLYGMGNPDLKQDVTRQLSLSVSRKGHSFSAEYSSTPDAMITTIKTSDGISYVQKRNEGTNKILFFVYNYGGNLCPWWYTNFSAQTAYLYYPDSYQQETMWWGSLKWTNRFDWERIGTFDLSAIYMTKYLQADIVQERKGLKLDVSYEHYFGKHIIASVGVEDILNGFRTHSVHKSPTVIYDFQNNNYSPSVWCKLTYKFSNNRKTKAEQLENTNEILKRM